MKNFKKLLILSLFCLSSFNLEIKPFYIPDPEDEILEEQEAKEQEARARYRSLGVDIDKIEKIKNREEIAREKEAQNREQEAKEAKEQELRDRETRNQEQEVKDAKDPGSDACPTESKIKRLISDLYDGIEPAYTEAKLLLSNKAFVKNCISVTAAYALTFATKHFTAEHLSSTDPSSGSYTEFFADLGADPTGF